MILTAYYDKEAREDLVWYDSSSVLFSRYKEDGGELTVIFKDGGKYAYHGVDMPTSYLLFKHGSEGGSQGKSLNKFVKGIYPFDKLDKAGEVELMELEALRVKCQDRNNEEEVRNRTYFISGHRELSEEKFRKYYVPAINEVVMRSSSEESAEDPIFIMGDYIGCDIMAQNYLIDELGYPPENVIVFHMFGIPMNINPGITRTVGHFSTDEERDAAMTERSAYDIAFVDDHLKLSGTGMNLLRRKLMK